jgi:hypothetical protein
VTRGWGRAGGWIAASGLAALVLDDILAIFSATQSYDSTAATIVAIVVLLAPVVVGIGFVVAGIAALRAPGRGRFRPLVGGVFVLVVMVPIMVARPSLSAWPVAIACAWFILLGTALYRSADQGARPDAP